MPPKVRKGKRRKRARKVKKTKSDYENQLVELNRQLALLVSETADDESVNYKLQGELDKTVEELDDVKGCLNYEIQCENDEIAELNLDIDKLEHTKSTQAKKYNKIVDELVERRNKELEKQEEDIYNVETSLKILKHFKNLYEEYLVIEEEMKKNEQEQLETFKETIYKENRKLLLEESVVKDEMKRQIEELSSPLKYALSPDGIKERIAFLKQTNNNLRDLLMITNAKYKTILPIYEKMYNEVIDGLLNVKLTEDRLIMVKKGKVCQYVTKVVREVRERRYSRLWSLSEPESYEDRNVKVKPKVVEEDPTIVKLFNEIESLAHVAINLSIDENNDDSNSTESDSIISMNVEHLYEERLHLIENIAGCIKNYFETNKPKDRLKKRKGKMRKAGYIIKAPRVLQREFFYKTLCQPKQREITTLKEKAGIILDSTSNCCKLK